MNPGLRASTSSLQWQLSKATKTITKETKLPAINFSNVQDSFQPLPDGTYNAVLGEISSKVSQKGDPYLVFTFNLTDEYEGRKAWRNFSLLPQSLWSIKSAMVALGADRDDLSGEFETIEDFIEYCSGFIGQPCQLELTVKEFNDKLSNEVKKVKSA